MCTPNKRVFPLSELTLQERRIMFAIYSSDSQLPFDEFVNYLNELYQIDWRLTTASTYMKRLIEKGYLKKQKVGVHAFYLPIYEKGVFQRACLRELQNELFQGDRDALLMELKRLDLEN